MTGFMKPVDEAASSEPESAPPALMAAAAGTANFHVRCTLKDSGVFVGWLDYSGPGNHLYLTGSDKAKPGGLTCTWYLHDGMYLNPQGTYVGNPRYLGNNGNDSNWKGIADWNYFGRSVAIAWNKPDGLITYAKNTGIFLASQGSGWVNWSNDATIAMNCECVPV
jgi:hypothetical protein